MPDSRVLGHCQVRGGGAGATGMQGLPAAGEGQCGRQAAASWGMEPAGRRHALDLRVPASLHSQVDVQQWTWTAGHSRPPGQPETRRGPLAQERKTGLRASLSFCSPPSWYYSQHRPGEMAWAEARALGRRPYAHRAHRAQTHCPRHFPAPTRWAGCPGLLGTRSGPLGGADPGSSSTHWFLRPQVGARPQMGAWPRAAR